MATRAPETERAPAEPIRSSPPRSTGPGWRGVWIAAIVALVAGAAGGYLVGRYIQPAETNTVTKTVVVKTTTPEPYLAGTVANATVTFDGTACMFNGPTEMRAGTEVTFDYSATVPKSTLLLFAVTPGTTYEQVLAATDATNPPGFVADFMTSQPRNATQQSLTMRMTPGMWVVSCSMNPDTSTGAVTTATILRGVAS